MDTERFFWIQMARTPCIVVDSFFGRLRGLMFSASVKKPLLFVFDEPARHAIHSFFCPAFDAVFVGEDGRVVDVFEVRHWGLWFAPKKDAKYLVEAAPGFARRVQEGQVIRVNVDGSWLDVA